MFAFLPPATRGLILVNVAVFLLQLLAGPSVEPRVLALFALWPLDTQQFQAWQLVTYAFLHGSVAHIFFNMFAVFMFGRALEEYWGSRRFLTYYFASVLAAGATQLAVQQAAGTTSETI